MTTNLFDDVAHTPAQHFRLALYGVIARIVEQCTGGDLEAAFEGQPFLADYHRQLLSHTGSDGPASTRWSAALLQWEACAARRLPICSLLAAGVGRLELELLLAAGLVEEDPRFGDAFEHAQGRERRPSFALLLAWWRVGPDGADRADAVRQALQGLLQGGLLQVRNPDAPRPDWLLAVPHSLWDALRGEVPALPWLQHRPHASLKPLHGVVAAPELRVQYDALPALLHVQPEQVIVVRGPRHNGRRTLLAGIAHALGKGLLVADASVFDEAPRWRLFGVLAVLLDAMPALHCELSSGETRTLPALPFATTLGVATSRHGAWASADARSLLTLDLGLPHERERLRHWQAAVPGQPADALRALAAGARLTSGNIHRAARAAASYAALARREEIAPGDVLQACRSLQASRLETLATRLPAQGGLHDLAVDGPTREELDALAARCRHREALAAGSAALAQGNAGVRALFAGSSGTGKTLAARLLAASLGKDLYRVDLAATVNKYIGETEKNLDQAFAAAEELDVVLLLDEGDALMAGRTDVGSSNDRYANLETNFLLQRIESFDGILLVTSNTADRIDKAFSRRMDVVINFRPPDEWRRYDILKLHLAGEEVDDDWLQQMACRCALTGGQLRNIVGHAHLLALQDGGAMRTEHLYAALGREYRKTGATCPLRPSDASRPVPAH